jgi:hypothetical protein
MHKPIKQWSVGFSFLVAKWAIYLVIGLWRESHYGLYDIRPNKMLFFPEKIAPYIDEASSVLLSLIYWQLFTTELKKIHIQIIWYNWRV